MHHCCQAAHRQASAGCDTVSYGRVVSLGGMCYNQDEVWRENELWLCAAGEGQQQTGDVGETDARVKNAANHHLAHAC
jgi:hypothetical protein